MVEGQGSKTFSKARKMLWARPDLAHRLLDMITESTIAYLKRQIDAGAQLLQIFDSWAGILSAEQYRVFGIPYLERICRAIDLKVPVTLFAKGAHFSIRDLALLECNTIGDRKSTRLNSSHVRISYAVFCLKKKKK